MSTLTIFKSSIPTGMRIFENGVDVAELNKHGHAARKFAKRCKRKICLECISDQKDDPKAIRVIGKSKGWFFESSKYIGYVPANIAKKLMLAELADKVKARLQSISIDNKHSIEIRFDIFGPKNDYKKYRSKHQSSLFIAGNTVMPFSRNSHP
jgi:hypothetical protein